ncbi:MAG: 30S ribosomal protein S6 [bacterium]|nr:30S ribosomal protein S6 [bacterium]
MQVYETTFIVNPQLEDAGIDQRVAEIADLISSNGGKTIHVDHMGTRRLAYQIQGLTQGYYGCFIYEASEDTPRKLERHFCLNDVYLRHLTVRFEGDPAKLGEKPEEENERRSDGPSRPPVGTRRPDAAPAAKPALPAEAAETTETAAKTEEAAPTPEPEPEKPADTEEPEQL